MVVERSTDRRQTWFLPVRFLLVVVTVALLYLADRAYEWHSDAMTSTFSPQLWRWYLASAAVVAAGVAAGLALRSRPPVFTFSVVRAVVLAVVPFTLAMTFPMWVRGWWGTSIESWMWSIRANFLDEKLVVPMWFLVGLALAAGFGEARVVGGSEVRASTAGTGGAVTLPSSER